MGYIIWSNVPMTYQADYASRTNRCPQCADILARGAKFPEQTTEEQKAVIDRVKKLFALSESPNENEAAAALARANELLEKHNLTRGVVEDTAQQKAEKGETDSLGVNVQPYKYTLVQATVKLHDVEWYRKGHKRAAPPCSRSVWDKHIVFLGLPANVATALVTLPYLVATTEAFSRAVRRDGETNLRDYRLGFATASWRASWTSSAQPGTIRGVPS
jgi:hypothetical protein